MPVTTDLVGTVLDPATHHVDARWTMAYAAALGDDGPRYFDTTSTGGVVAHPMFAVCVEWPVIVSGREASEKLGITPDETRRSVHATHDLTVHRLIRPGDTLTTTAVFTGAEQRSPGAFVTTRLETRDVSGGLVATTEQGNLHLGVPIVGADRPSAASAGPVPEIEGSAAMRIPVSIAHGAAHTYTECARIWNPIHTDEAVASTAGLPGIILHGTATMALAVSRVVDECTDGDPSRVRRIIGRFGAQVLMPSTVTVRIGPPSDTPLGGRSIPYDVLTADDGKAVDRGVIMTD